MFPTIVTKNDSLENQIDGIKSSVKFQLKKVTCLAVPIGREELTDEQLRQNINMALNFLVSLLKKGWHNMKTVNVKSTMSKAEKLL